MTQPQPNKPEVPLEALCEQASRMVAEVHRRGGNIEIDLADIPEELLIRELLARTCNAFLVGQFRDHEGTLLTKFRHHGDNRATVLGLLHSATWYVARHDQKAWKQARGW